MKVEDNISGGRRAQTMTRKRGMTNIKRNKQSNYMSTTMIMLIMMILKENKEGRK